MRASGNREDALTPANGIEQDCEHMPIACVLDLSRQRVERVPIERRVEPLAMFADLVGRNVS